MDNYYALIMAGGGGTRLWPLSRKNRPKQMLSLLGEESMFRVSVMRLAALFPPERILVVTGQNQVEALQADVPELPRENFILEPHGRDSGPAAALGVAHIYHRNPQAVIAILTADHYIRDAWGFSRALRAAYEAAQEGYIVTLGIKPSYPATGFGYIQQGPPLAKKQGLQVYHSAGFKEKPGPELAQEFLESGLYSWNSGMFIWTAAQALGEFEGQQAALYAALQKLMASLQTGDYASSLERNWGQMTKISLDYAVMEKAERMAMIPVDIGWTDIGSWASVYDELATRPGDNILRGEGQHLSIESQGLLVNSSRLVVTIGLQDVVIVDTPDVLMLCPRDRAQEVKQAVEALKQNGLDRYL
jgi:mannose-1-phosphate guanylyltransferase